MRDSRLSPVGCTIVARSCAGCDIDATLSALGLCVWVLIATLGAPGFRAALAILVLSGVLPLAALCAEPTLALRTSGVKTGCVPVGGVGSGDVGAGEGGGSAKWNGDEGMCTLMANLLLPDAGVSNVDVTSGLGSAGSVMPEIPVCALAASLARPRIFAALAPLIRIFLGSDDSTPLEENQSSSTVASGSIGDWMAVRRLYEASLLSDS